jgi:hypothetical protein
MLELFEGQISLNEILTTDYWMLADMAKAKNRLIAAKAKARESQMMQEQMKNQKVK